MTNKLKIKEKKIGIYINNYELKKIFFLIKNLGIKVFSFFIYPPWINKKNIFLFYKINKIFFFLKKNNILNSFFIAHSSFLINLGHYIKEKLYFYRYIMIKEIHFCNLLKVKYIVFHIGYHLNMISKYKCIQLIIKSINYIINKTKNIILLIENTVNKGTSIGYSLEQISYIISNIENKSRIGVCIDICHAFSSGYDLRNFSLCEYFFLNFHNIIGLNYLKAIHLNGSKYNFNSKRDRHDSIMNNFIGNNIFYWIMKNNFLNNIPLILESKDNSLWIKEIMWLYSI